MKNTDYNLNALGNMIATDAAFQALQGMIDDLGLEVGDITTL